MSLPSLTRTWQFSPCVTAAAGSSVTDAAANLLLAVKAGLLGTGSWTDASGGSISPSANWTVIGSSNGVSSNMSGTDLWTNIAAFVFAGAGGRSWIVLQQTGISSNFQVLIHCNSSSPEISIRVSTTGYGTAHGGTDGSSTAAPTATSDVAVMAGNSGIAVTTAVLTRVTVMRSADGAATRVALHRSNKCAGIWFFEAPANGPSGWSVPVVCHVAGATSAAPIVDTPQAPGAFLTNKLLNLIDSGWFTAAWNVLGDTTDGIGFTSQTTPDTRAAAYPLFTPSIRSYAAGNIGGYGQLVDQWLGLTIQPTGTTYPAAGTKNLVHACGPLVWPWNTSVPLFA